MGEAVRIEDQLTRSFEGKAWHGPSVTDLLLGVDAEAAAARPLPGAHTIWEIVLHMSVWQDVVRRRLEGERIDTVSTEDDWPAVGEPGKTAWGEAMRRLHNGHERLRASVGRLDDLRLGDKVPERDHTVYHMLHGIIQHNLYHAGQIAILRKAHPERGR